MKLRLQNEYGYPASGTKLIVDRLAILSPELYIEFEKWWISGELPSIEIEGYTIQKLINEHHQNLIAAFLTLSWLEREPNQAKDALRRGYDQISSEVV